MDGLTGPEAGGLSISEPVTTVPMVHCTVPLELTAGSTKGAGGGEFCSTPLVITVPLMLAISVY